MYPIKIKVRPEFLEELYQSEYGRYEDAQNARRRGDQENIEANNYQVVACDFLDRWKTQIEVRNDAELHELYYACASGTIGVNGYTRAANAVLNRIRDKVREIDPNLVEMFPYQNGF